MRDERKTSESAGLSDEASEVSDDGAKSENEREREPCSVQHLPYNFTTPILQHSGVRPPLTR